MHKHLLNEWLWRTLIALKMNKLGPYVSISVESRNSPETVLGGQNDFWTCLLYKFNTQETILHRYLHIVKHSLEKKYKILMVVATGREGKDDSKEKRRRRNLRVGAGKQRRLQFTSVVLFLLIKIHLKHKWQSVNFKKKKPDLEIHVYFLCL